MKRLLARLRCYLAGHDLLWEKWAALDVDAECYTLGCTSCRRYWPTIQITCSLLAVAHDVQAFTYGVLTALEVDAQKRWWKR